MRLENLVLALATLTVAMVNGMTLGQHRQKRQNYDALLQNKAFVESQINCVLRRGQCDRIGNRIKILVPEVVKTKECKSCNEDEKGNVQKVADHVQSHYPKEWNEIREQYTEDDDDDDGEELDQLDQTGSDSDAGGDAEGEETSSESGSGVTPADQSGEEGVDGSDQGLNALDQGPIAAATAATTNQTLAAESTSTKTEEKPINPE